jgi:hypothetical protein
VIFLEENYIKKLLKVRRRACDGYAMNKQRNYYYLQGKEAST